MISCIEMTSLSMTVDWHWRSFEEFDVKSLYAVLEVRQSVFNVEQKILYQDADGYDRDAYHLTGEIDGSIVAYLRVLQPGKKYKEASIGRVLTRADVRGRGIGRELMAEALRRIMSIFPKAGVRISAQKYLTRFYGDLGFVEVGEEYEEHKVPHIEMVLK